MFFGHEVKTNQNKASSLTMDNDVKLSQAVLDPASKGNRKDPVVLVAEVERKSFILAVLDPSQSWQCPLDLMLAAGTEVKFFLRGQGCVHLTGYEFRDDDFEMSMSSDDEDEEELDSARKSKHVAKKIKTKASPQKVNGVKSNHQHKLSSKGDEKDNGDDSDDSDDDEDLSFGSEDDDLDSSDLDNSSSDAMDQGPFGDSDDSDIDEDDDDDDEEEDDDSADEDADSDYKISD